MPVPFIDQFEHGARFLFASFAGTLTARSCLGCRLIELGKIAAIG